MLVGVAENRAAGLRAGVREGAAAEQNIKQQRKIDNKKQ